MAIENYNLLNGTNFKFTTSKVPGVEYFCTDVTFPSISIGQIAMDTPMGPHYEPGVSIQFTELSCDFLVDEEMSNYFELFKWMRECSVPPKNPTPYPGGKFFPFADLSLTILDNTLNAQYEINFVNAFPVSLGSISFDSDVDTPVPARCNVMFRFDHFEKVGDPVYV